MAQKAHHKRQPVKYKRVALDTLHEDPANARRHGDRNRGVVRGSLREWGQVENLVVEAGTGRVLGGNCRLSELLAMGETEAMVAEVDVHGTDATRLSLVLNRSAELAEWGDDLGDLLKSLDEEGADLDGIGWDADDLDALIAETTTSGDGEGGSGSLSDRFGVPPFSVWDARQGYWQERKREWMARIGDKGETRENTLFRSSGDPVSDKLQDGQNGVSILDPVLSELVCRWFAKPGHKALDPFAGDSVFGFVAASVGLEFTGIELRPEQAEINQARVDNAGLSATYICDTAENIDAHIEDASVDLLFSCPPYADLEVYSDDPRDLSTLAHAEFLSVLSACLVSAASKLKPGRFACIVMGEVRGKGGEYIGIVPRVISAMESAGLRYWAEVILVQPAGTAALRATRQMNATRKVCRTHQTLLVFYNGKQGDIKAEFGAVSFQDAEEA